MLVGMDELKPDRTSGREGRSRVPTERMKVKDRPSLLGWSLLKIRRVNRDINNFNIQSEVPEAIVPNVSHLCASLVGFFSGTGCIYLIC
ncbi:hypothetical protein TNCV_4597801 [Trichonephila clavipes]|nr:hypothetical protein TNCV_4597801 [Trichonephila clavipes]